MNNTVYKCRNFPFNLFFLTSIYFALWHSIMSIKNTSLLGLKPWTPPLPMPTLTLNHLSLVLLTTFNNLNLNLKKGLLDVRMRRPIFYSGHPQGGRHSSIDNKARRLVRNILKKHFLTSILFKVVF